MVYGMFKELLLYSSFLYTETFSHSGGSRIRKLIQNSEHSWGPPKGYLSSTAIQRKETLFGVAFRRLCKLNLMNNHPPY